MLSDITGGNYVLDSRSLADVRKYTASSFYNWEQDNIPIEDLESRTNALAANTGQLSTSIEGVTMVLSSTADNTLSVYDSITDILDRIPKVITFPILVELCDYGDLGELKLEGITIEDGGALQFINRNFAASIDGNNANTNKVRAYKGYSLDDAVPWKDEAYPIEISSQDTWNKISAAASTRIGASCFVSGTNGWNQNLKVFGTVKSDTEQPLAEPFFWTSSTQPFIDYSSEQAGTHQYTFSGTAYDYLRDASVSSSDANPKEFATAGQRYFRYSDYVPSGTVSGTIVSPVYSYGSHFTNVKIEDCRGSRIQLKGICVDGVSALSVVDSGYGTHHASAIGFDIQNSDVILTSCASFRNRVAGFNVYNSNVTIEGGIVGYRNYPLNGNKIATSNPESSRADDGFSDLDLWDIDTSGNGFVAKNSTVTFDSSRTANNASGTSNLGKHGYMMMSNGGNGWLFEDCKIYGGVGGHDGAQEQGAGPADYQTTQINGSFNKINGVVFEDCNVKYQGIIRAQGNEKDGIKGTKSAIGAMGVVSELNQETGLHLDSSKFVYNIGAQQYTTGYAQGDASSWKNRAGHSEVTPAICATDNGQYNIRVNNNSSFSDSRMANSGEFAGLVGGRAISHLVRGMQAANGRILDSGSVSEYEKGNLPLISVNNNSYARILGLGAIGDIVKNNNPAVYTASSLKGAIKGRAVQATNNSNVDLYGTSAHGTSITVGTFSDSVDDLKLEWTKSALYAGSNSKIRIAGPTKITSHGVAALAEHYSKIEIGPATDSDGAYDPSLITDENNDEINGHTRVELHASRACLVANDKSTLEMIKCGVPASGIAHPNRSGTGADTSSINVAELNLNKDWAHLGSFIQFYPQGFTAEAANNAGGKSGDIDYRAMHTVPGAYNRTTAGLDASSDPDVNEQVNKSSGGMCVRAVGGSNVIVDQVNFQVKSTEFDLSGAYYNIDGSGLEHSHGYAGSAGNVADPATFLGSTSAHYGGSRILMWNIADNSRIVASNLRVNGGAPKDCGYHGPAGRYGVANGHTANAGPLDYYGKGGHYVYVINNKSFSGGTNTFYNHGPFRLMTGVGADLMSYYEFMRSGEGDPAATYSNQASGTFTQGKQAHKTMGGSPIAQLNAQGYAGAGVGASSIDYSDYRLHSLIEQQFNGGALGDIADLHYPDISITHQGQPIFGGYADADAEADMNTFLNTVFPVQMLEQAQHGQHDGDSNMRPQFPFPPIHMEWQGYLRNFLDETAADTFANSKHSASKMVKQCSIFRSTTDPTAGGEGRDGTEGYTFGHGVRSLNLFDLNKLV